MVPEVPIAVGVCHDLLKWILSHLDKLPRTRRYTLALHLEQNLLGVLGDLVSATYARDKRADLERANRQLAIARHLWRLCLELGLIPQRTWQHGADLIVELGKQVGGWQKHANR